MRRSGGRAGRSVGWLWIGGRRSARPALATVVAALAAVVLWPPVARAQDPAPLTKSELIRLLSEGIYSDGELATIVRRSCISFEPTLQDRRDLSTLGAGEELMGEIAACAGRPLEVTLRPELLTLRAGGTGPVGIRVMRAGRPIPGARLALTGTERIAGASGRPPSATTDGSGRAVLNVPAGVAARAYRLPVRVSGADPAPAAILRLRVLPGPPASARTSPGYLRVERGRDTTVGVRATLQDAFGNPIGGERLLLGGPEPHSEPLSTGATGTDGVVELAVRVGELEDEGPLLLRAGGRTVAELPVELLDPPARQAASGAEADRELAAGRPARAAERFRAALELEPADSGAIEGLARAARAEGDLAEAALQYGRALERRPDDVALRLELARTLERSNRRREAERAYRELLARAPGHRIAARELALLRSQPYAIEVSAWAGTTLESELESNPTLRAAEMSLRPIRALRVWGRYDRSLGLDHPPLIRGGDEIDGFFGGAALLWGSGGRLATQVEVGRRTDEVENLSQNVVRVEQVVRVPAGRSFVGLTAGGFLGRWFDRDDWLIYGRADLPVGATVAVRPALFVGETIGTNGGETGRAPEREVRFLLPIGYEHPAGWRFEPAGAVGEVEGETEATSGTLLEARLLAEAPIGGANRLRLLLRHQSPPGSRPFTLATLGLQLRLP